jgi:hypothetical protein
MLITQTSQNFIFLPTGMKPPPNKIWKSSGIKNGAKNKNTFKGSILMIIYLFIIRELKVR